MFDKKVVFLTATLIALVIVCVGGNTSALGSSYEVVSVQTPQQLASLIDPPDNASFPTWLGADAATSVRVDDSTYVWLFGDTLIGKSVRGKRDYSVFIHNTVGVSRKTEGGGFSRIEKYWRDNGDIGPIFPSSEKDKFYWPVVGVRLNSSLLVACDRVSTGGTQSFSVLGTTLFLVQNPEDDPDDWNYSSKYLPKKDGVTWGSAVLVKDGWLYIFGEKGSGIGSKTTLARIRVENAERGDWGDLYFHREGSWVHESSPSPISGLPGVSETTVQHNRFFGWYSLGIPPLGYDVHLYTAADLTGPWKDQGAVYSVPSPWSKEKTKGGKAVFIAYAVKSHPELASRENEIVITYNVNLDPFVDGLTEKMNDYIGQEKYEGLYVPRFALIELRRSPE
ncbi:MAG: hypothetical protein ACOC88_00440 [Candidatus Bipolaricaulota bacterium]